MVNKEQVIEVLKEVLDPELNIDIWTMGLVYDIDLSNGINIRMTYTTPLCPYGPSLREDVVKRIKERFNVEPNVEITFEPPWKMSDELRGFLGA